MSHPVLRHPTNSIGNKKPQRLSANQHRVPRWQYESPLYGCDGDSVSSHVETLLLRRALMASTIAQLISPGTNHRTAPRCCIYNCLPLYMYIYPMFYAASTRCTLQRVKSVPIFRSARFRSDIFTVFLFVCIAMLY